MNEVGFSEKRNISQTPTLSSLTFQICIKVVRYHLIRSIMDHSTEFEPHVEDANLVQIVNEILKFLMLKRGGSLLVLGGKSWNFGRAVWQTSTAPNCVYADNDQASLDSADQDEALTVNCDLTQSEDITKLGKYDGIVAKDALEFNTESLAEFLASLHKILKYGGKVVFVCRLNPTLVLPKTVRDNWQNSMPDIDKITLEAKEFDLSVDYRNCRFQVCMEKEKYEKILLRRLWPFMQNVTDGDIEELLSTYPELIQFEDKMDLIMLTKEMLD